MSDLLSIYKDAITTSVSVAALGLGMLNLIDMRRRQSRERRAEAERPLNDVWDLLFGEKGYEQNGDDAQLRRAREIVAQALSACPSSFKAIRYQGLLHDLAGDRQAAQSAYRKALQLKPKDAVTLNWLGLAIGTENAGEAIRCFEEAIEVFPEDSASAHYNLARILRRVGHREEAHHHFEQATRLRPLDPDCLVGLARSLRSIGRWQEAKHLYERAVSSRRRNIDAMVELGAIVATHENWEAGLAWIHDAKKSAPTDSYAATVLAVLHSRRGEQEEAMHYYEEAVGLDPRLRLSGGDLEQLRSRIEEEKELDFPPPEEEVAGKTSTDIWSIVSTEAEAAARTSA